MRTGNRVRRLVLCWFAPGIVAGLGGCGETGGGGNPPPPPTVTIKSVAAYYGGSSALNLPYAIAGQGSFTLLVNGTGFTSSSAINWNGNPLPTQFADSTDLAASVSSSLITVPGKATITVANSSTTSDAVVLPIASAAAATAGVVALITAAMDGSPANGDSLVAPSISATGRYVAFQSNAPNLAPGPASGFQEIYERDTCLGAPSGCTPNTIRITVTYDGSPVNAHSRTSAISDDGRYIAFDSQATNILPGTSACASPSGTCVFLRDTCLGVPSGCAPNTSAITVAIDGTISGGSLPAVSADGRYVAFYSISTNIVSGDNNGVGDMFLRDTCNGAPSGCTPSTIPISVSSTGSQANAQSFPAIVNTTGRFAAFVSFATNLTPLEAVVPGIFLRDTCAGISSGCSPSTARVDVTASGAQPNQASSATFPAITPDGRLVAFGSTATNFVPTNLCTNAGACSNVYVRDTCTGTGGCAPTTSLISVGNDGSIGNCNGGGSPGNQTNVFLSADGRLVSFGSISTNLTPDDTLPACGGEDIFVRDTCFGVASSCTPSTVRVSVANMPNPGTSANSISAGNAMSADGHYVVFISGATNFLPGLTGNGHPWST